VLHLTSALEDLESCTPSWLFKTNAR